MNKQVMELPKLYAPVKISFWSLRNGIGSGLGVIFDIDTKVTRMCRRVLCMDYNWKWQLVETRGVEYDPTIRTDMEILSEYGSDIDVEYVK